MAPTEQQRKMVENFGRSDPALAALLRAQTNPQAKYLAQKVGVDLSELGARNRMLFYYVVALVQVGEDTDENLKLWFGGKENVKEVRQQVRWTFLSPPDVGSPSDLMMRSIGTEDLRKGKKATPRPPSKEEKKQLKMLERSKQIAAEVMRGM